MTNTTIKPGDKLTHKTHGEGTAYASYSSPVANAVAYLGDGGMMYFDIIADGWVKAEEAAGEEAPEPDATQKLIDLFGVGYMPDRIETNDSLYKYVDGVFNIVECRAGCESCVMVDSTHSAEELVSYLLDDSYERVRHEPTTMYAGSGLVSDGVYTLRSNGLYSASLAEGIWTYGELKLRGCLEDVPDADAENKEESKELHEALEGSPTRVETNDSLYLLRMDDDGSARYEVVKCVNENCRLRTSDSCGTVGWTTPLEVLNKTLLVGVETVRQSPVKLGHSGAPWGALTLRDNGLYSESIPKGVYTYEEALGMGYVDPQREPTAEEEGEDLTPEAEERTPHPLAGRLFLDRDDDLYRITKAGCVTSYIGLGDISEEAEWDTIFTSIEEHRYNYGPLRIFREGFTGDSFRELHAALTSALVDPDVTL